MATPGFDKGAGDRTWERTAFTADAAAGTNSTETACCLVCLIAWRRQKSRPNLALNSVFALHLHVKRVKKTG